MEEMDWEQAETDWKGFLAAARSGRPVKAVAAYGGVGEPPDLSDLFSGEGTDACA